MRYDRILCSPYVDVAAFRGLAPSWVRQVPLLTYFHENQFAYPVQAADERDFHFALTNMTTALASDSLAFNSRYNLTSFLKGIGELLRLSHDLKLDDPCRAIQAKSKVLAPGIDFSLIDAMEEPEHSDTPVIVWNHRWEHDKNPELFFNTLFKLDRDGIDFKLAVLGESFKDYPPVFDEARNILSHRILHFGFVTSRRDYIRWLKYGDIVVSTARHEFFGMAVIEAVRAGCRPFLPHRLSYPELFPDEFLYADKYFMGNLKDRILNHKRLSLDQRNNLTEPFSWDVLASSYCSWIADTTVSEQRCSSSAINSRP
jgi:glycosyltransferase involved in cell wall biosynthesis